MLYPGARLVPIFLTTSCRTVSTNAFRAAASCPSALVIRNMVKTSATPKLVSTDLCTNECPSQASLDALRDLQEGYRSRLSNGGQSVPGNHSPEWIASGENLRLHTGGDSTTLGCNPAREHEGHDCARRIRGPVALRNSGSQLGGIRQRQWRDRSALVRCERQAGQPKDGG